MTNHGVECRSLIERPLLQGFLALSSGIGSVVLSNTLMAGSEIAPYMEGAGAAVVALSPLYALTIRAVVENKRGTEL